MTENGEGTMARFSAAVRLCDLADGRIVFEADQSPESLSSLELVVHSEDGTSKAIDTEPDGHALTFDLAQALPVATVELRDSATGQAVVTLPDLYFSTNKDFEGGFKSRKTRPDDPHLDYFIASQTLITSVDTWGTASPAPSYAHIRVPNSSTS
ncbi:hypothetical protein [Nesterenkonia sp. NBAIMH1]|uniref:hypothetical protein n=1 Tax=Nesterenkonia sp. NBAIMH1 TaxID=2600320 RepID=UPI0011B750CC|nr:hypothetical protein [Nesterenkonia sp. NBAIMH1]